MKMLLRDRCQIGVLIGLCILLYGAMAWAADSPHTGSLVGCDSCHTAHNAAGAGLTKAAGNANLCLSCHYSGGRASDLPFSSAMQPSGNLKTSHSWSGSMPNSSNDQGVNNPYGLRTSDQLSNSMVSGQLSAFGLCSINPTVNTQKTTCQNAGGVWTAQAVCSVCHSVMSHSGNPWDPAATAPVDTGTATGGSTTMVIDGSKSWTSNQWAGYYVRMTSSPNLGLVQHIAGNTGTTLTFMPGAALGHAVSSGNTYEIESRGRHFLRTNNDLNQLCEDCHYYRSPAALTDVKIYDGNKKSHPVAKNLTTDVANPDLFIGAVPYEPKCSAACSNSAWTTVGACTGNGGTWDPQYCRQTGSPRYHQNGGADTNSTNNIVFDADGKIRCMSCHGVHYSDSKSSTVERP